MFLPPGTVCLRVNFPNFFDPFPNEPNSIFDDALSKLIQPLTISPHCQCGHQNGRLFAENQLEALIHTSGHKTGKLDHPHKRPRIGNDTVHLNQNMFRQLWTLFVQMFAKFVFTNVRVVLTDFHLQQASDPLL